MMDPLLILRNSLSAARHPDLPKQPEDLRIWLDCVIANSEDRKGVLAVLITLLVKKILSPSQDIRLHQAKFDGGFSARTFDLKAG